METIAFTFRVDQPLYFAVLSPPRIPVRQAPRLCARFSVHNRGEAPAGLDFADGQRYDLKILNGKGQEVFHWSPRRIFAQFPSTEFYEPGETSYSVLVELSGPDGKPYPPGKYRAEGWLTTLAGCFRGAAEFEIRNLPDPPLPPHR